MLFLIFFPCYMLFYLDYSKPVLQDLVLQNNLQQNFIATLVYSQFQATVQVIKAVMRHDMNEKA